MPLPDPYLYELPKGTLAISVSVKSFSAGLSDKLLPGDVVTVYATFSGGEKETYTAIQPPELTAVEILAVTAEGGADLDEQNREQTNTSSGGQTGATITLLSNSAQAAALAGLEQNASIHLALAARASSPEKEGLLEEQKKVLEEAAKALDPETDTDAVDPALPKTEEPEPTEQKAGDDALVDTPTDTTPPENTETEGAGLV